MDRYLFRAGYISLCDRESGCLSLQKVIMILHLPTFMLIIGYIVFWLEMYFLKVPRGQTTPLAWVAWVVFSLYLIIQLKGKFIFYIKGILLGWRKQSVGVKIFVCVGGVVSIFILGEAFLASLFPPHLMQESDVLNYHYTLPRQHLITHSFRHISWSSADLFPLPIQFALAPYWFSTEFPNKLPQFFIFVGLICVVVNIVRHLGVKNTFGVSVLLYALLGSHNIGIQLGTAMLDLTICYLFIAFIDSFLNKAYLLAAVEFSFFLWSKSFVPIQAIFIAVALYIFLVLARKFNFALNLDFENGVDALRFKDYKSNFPKFLGAVLLVTIVSGGPFLLKSFYYSGTPLYPFGVGLISIPPNMPSHAGLRQSLQEAAEAHLSYRDSYGYGRSLRYFIQHFWFIAVPAKDVNNKFDYPVGLPYLLFLGPFTYSFFQSIKKKIFTILPFFVVIYWFLWWQGVQQTRFLYIPIVLMYLVVIPAMKNISPVFCSGIILALALNALSVFRAHQGDFCKPPLKVLREKDLYLIGLNREYVRDGRRDYVDLPFGDIAFAQFAVNVTEKKLPFIISH